MLIATRRPTILVSSIGLMWTLLGFSLPVWLARRFDFDGMQLSPQRGLPKDRYQVVDLVCRMREAGFLVPLAEDVWDRQSQWDITSKVVFDSLPAADERLAGIKAVKPPPKFIGHEIGEKIVELHPGTGLLPTLLMQQVRESGADACSDFYHWRRPFNFSHQKQLDETERAVFFAAWKDSWRHGIIADGDLIRIVHVQPLRQLWMTELFRWLFGLHTELGEMVDTTRRHCQNVEYWVVELSPPGDPDPAKNNVATKILKLAMFPLWFAVAPFVNGLACWRLRKQLAD